jgi:hypothetical protein
MTVTVLRTVGALVEGSSSWVPWSSLATAATPPGAWRTADGARRGAGRDSLMRRRRWPV